MTGRAWIGNVELVRHRGRDETESMRMNHRICRTFRFNRRHVASDALTPRTAVFVVRVFFQCGRSGAVGRHRTVAVQAELVGWFSKLRVVSCSVNVVAVKAGDSAAVHHTLDKIVALHSVFMGCAVWIIKEIRRLAESVILKLPIVCELQSHVIPNRPIVIFPVNRIREGLPLRVTLNAGITGRDVAHMLGINDIAARGMRDVLTAGAVATLAADIPFSDLLGVNVVANRMTSIAKRACRPVEVVTRIERCPPVAPRRRHVVLAPFLVYDLPLHGQGKIIITDFREITLLPDASVNEGNLIFGKLVDVVRREIGNDCIGMLSRIADDIGHWRFLPMIVNIGVTFLARLRAGVMCRR